MTAELADRFGVGVRLVPVTDDPLRTRLLLAGGDEVGFQEYFVKLRHDVVVERVRFEGAAAARPGPGVLEAIAGADTVVVCPSNPVVSIDPLLAVPGVSEALVRRRDRTVAVSPIVAGAALKGPADRLLVEMGFESSVVGVARWYAPWVSPWSSTRPTPISPARSRPKGCGAWWPRQSCPTSARSAALARVVLDARLTDGASVVPGAGAAVGQPARRVDRGPGDRDRRGPSRRRPGRGMLEAPCGTGPGRVPRPPGSSTATCWW